MLASMGTAVPAVLSGPYPRVARPWASCQRARPQAGVRECCTRPEPKQPREPATAHKPDISFRTFCLSRSVAGRVNFGVRHCACGGVTSMFLPVEGHNTRFRLYAIARQAGGNFSVPSASAHRRNTLAVKMPRNWAHAECRQRPHSPPDSHSLVSKPRHLNKLSTVPHIPPQQKNGNLWACTSLRPSLTEPVFSYFGYVCSGILS